MIPAKLIIKILPWALIVVLLVWVYLSQGASFIKGGTEVVNNTAIIERVEALGKMELVRYNFKEVTQISENAAEIAGIKFFESNVILISKGEAVGCIDLTKMKLEDINEQGDSLIIKLPNPELCYYKLDLNDTQIFQLDTYAFSNDKTLIEKAYKTAETEIKNAALNSGVLEQTVTNAELILKPMFENITGKKIIFTYPIDTTATKVILD
ncbi:MAG: DUF4230 domain-containing protein [Bacteroidota bacterium]